VSIIKGARNLDSAKKWVDFALTADVKSRSGEVKSYQVPSNQNAISPPEAPDVSSIKLINYNHALYGSKAERNRLLKKWDTDVKVLPR
jgi:iron(III) transport system substrate-binding protein